MENDLSEERNKTQNFEAEHEALKTRLVQLESEISNLNSEKAEFVKYYGLFEASAKEKADELLNLLKEKEQEEKSLQVCLFLTDFWCYFFPYYKGFFL